MALPRRDPPASGFAVIEISVATVLFALALASFYFVYVRRETSEQVGLELAEATQNARSGLDLMAREIRSAGGGAVPGLPPAIVTASQYRVTLALDRNGNRKLDRGEVVTYFLDPDPDNPLLLGGNPRDFVLRRTTSSADDTLAVPVPGRGEIVAYGLTQRSSDRVETKDVPIFSYRDGAETALELAPGAPTDPAGIFWGRTVADADLGRTAVRGGASRVKSVVVNVTTETRQKDPQTGSYDRVTVTAAVEPGSPSTLEPAAAP
ncbi:MAG TPA: hypothetical protein VID50_09095 [Candidatus Eisenbacteria bacterium]|jgi:hypothetical protein